MNSFAVIADKIEQKPELLIEAEETLCRWKKTGNIPAVRIEQWKTIVRRARRRKKEFTRLMAILRDNTEENRRLLDFAPFAGLLTRRERRKVFLKCAYDH